MPKHVYFSGIGGSGLAALAQLAQDSGYQVSGSDREASRNTALLKKRGIDAQIGQSGQEIAAAHQRLPIDWLIGTSALLTDHPELRFAKEQKIKISKRDELINQIVKAKNLKLVAISGTHGKTTTTAMLIWLFHQLKQPVSYSIGTNIPWGPSGQYQKDSQYFIYEADEFDRNFLAFKPYVSVIPAVEYDHSDTYPSVADYQAAFRQFIKQSHCSFTWYEVSAYLDLPKDGCLHVLDSAAAKLDQITLAGQHNKQNGYLAMAVVKDLLQTDDRLLLTDLDQFPGSERRMEKLKNNLYSDYAHHPTEIAATLELANELGKNVVAVYQPHQNIRQHEIRDKYEDCFRLAKKVYWLPTYLSREDPNLPVLEPKELITELDDPTKVEIADMDEDLASKIKEHLGAGDMVVVMGAGSIDPWARQSLLS